MIESSLATLLFSLLPFIVFHLAIEATVVWGASSGTMALFLVVHTIIVGQKLRTLDAQDEWSTWRFESLVGALIMSTVVIQSLNVLRIGFDRSLGAYLLGLILLLGLASMHFVALLVAVHASSNRARQSIRSLKERGPETPVFPNRLTTRLRPALALRARPPGCVRVRPSRRATLQS